VLRVDGPSDEAQGNGYFRNCCLQLLISVSLLAWTYLKVKGKATNLGVVELFILPLFAFIAVVCENYQKNIP
jgi:hypothetical protein